MLRQQITEVEQRAATERAEKGAPLLGRKTVLRQSFEDSPTSFEPRRGMSPRVAGENSSTRIGWRG